MIQPEQEDQEFNSWLVCAAALFGGVYLIGGICGAVFGLSFILDMDILLAIILPLAFLTFIVYAVFIRPLII